MNKRSKITSLLLAGALVVGLPYSVMSAKKAAVKKPDSSSICGVR